MLNAKERCITLDNYFFNFAPRVILRDDNHSFLFLASFQIAQYIIIRHNTRNKDLQGAEGFIIPYKIKEEDYIDEDCSIENIINGGREDLRLKPWDESPLSLVFLLLLLYNIYITRKEVKLICS